jgi:hypothetical protein
MKKRIERKSKTFIFLFFISIFSIAFALIATITKPESFYFILMGLGLLLFAYSISEPKERKSKMLFSGSFISFSSAFFGYSFLCFQSNKIVTATLFALLGIFIFGCFIYSLLKGDKSP